MAEVQETEADTAAIPSGPILLDGRPTRAPAVVVLSGASAAVWLVDLAGEACGAWVWPTLDDATARRVLALIDRRAFIAVDPVDTVDVVHAIATSASVTIPNESLSSRICSIPELLVQTGKTRADIEAAVEEEAAAGKKKLAPLLWDRPVPAEATNDLESLLEHSGIATARNSQVAAALQGARLARWAIGLWADTERERARRSYLRQRFGPNQPLPAIWTKAITGAYDSPFDP